MNQIFSDGEYNYCSCCGRKWRKGSYRPWWPIRIDAKYLFRKRPLGWTKNIFSVHYWQTGWKDINVRAFQRVIRIGRLIILTGPDKVDLGLTYIPEWQAWLHPKHAENASKHIREENTVKAAERFVNDRWKGGE